MGEDAVRQMNAANKEFSDWCQTLPIPLIIAGCEIHAKVQAAMFALDTERRAALTELSATVSALARLTELSGKLVAETKRIAADPGIPIHPTTLGPDLDRSMLVDRDDK